MTSERKRFGAAEQKSSAERSEDDETMRVSLFSLVLSFVSCLANKKQKKVQIRINLTINKIQYFIK